MKFGVTFPQTKIGTDALAIRDFAQATEGAGFDYMNAFDHVTGAHPDRFIGVDVGFPAPPYLYEDQFHEPFVLFSYLAGFTSSIEFATSILILPQRQTALVAKQAAALDILSGGRLRLGVGVGWNFTEFETLGQDFHTRGLRQAEQIIVMRKLWSEPLVSFEGRWHKLDRVGLSPRPARPIPVWIGGGTGERLLRRVARLADGWMPAMPSSEETEKVIARLHSHLQAAGRDVSTFGLQVSLRGATGRDSEAIVAAKHWQSMGATHLSVGGDPAAESPARQLENASRLKQLLETELSEQ
jgi:probable F420-dependent oxidoreductase